jgi:hypothetical protein
LNVHRPLLNIVMLHRTHLSFTYLAKAALAAARHYLLLLLPQLQSLCPCARSKWAKYQAGVTSPRSRLVLTQWTMRVPKTYFLAAAALCTHAILVQILVLGGITPLSSPLTPSRLRKVHRASLQVFPSNVQVGEEVSPARLRYTVCPTRFCTTGIP